MKLRRRGNYLRLRLQQQEVKRILESGFVIEKTSFGSRTFSYSFEAHDSADKMQAQFDSEGIRVIVPKSQVRAWAQSEELSLCGEQPAEDSVLKILIEKDLMCIKPRTSPLWEDESDAYPNPNTSCGGNHG